MIGEIYYRLDGERATGVQLGNARLLKEGDNIVISVGDTAQSMSAEEACALCVAFLGLFARTH